MLRSARNDNTPVPVVEWPKIQSIIQQSHSNVLILIDACYAAGIGAQAIPGTPNRGTVEIIAASAMEKTAKGPGIYSFTHALMRQLYEFANRDTANTFSVAVLHQALLSSIVTRPARYRQTPVYIRLDDGQRPSISLHLDALAAGQNENSRNREKQMANKAAREL